MKRKRTKPKPTPKVGDVVVIDGCHKNFRPTVRKIEEGVAFVSVLAGWKPYAVPLVKCELASEHPTKKGGKRGVSYS